MADPADAPRPYLGGRVEQLVHEFPDQFADADAEFDAARFVVVGLPYDATVSYRFGTKLGPAAIRQATWNLEQLNIRNGVDLREVPVHDMGDVQLDGLAPEKMFEAVEQAMRPVADAGKFLLPLGGEHSTIPPVVHALKRAHPDLKVLQLDAHLDYRREYQGSIDNHACAMRRIADAVGPESIVGIGIRSVERAEHAEAIRDGFRFYTSFDVDRRGMGEVLHEALDHLGSGPLYVTLDIDGIDPAFAPATGTPEPFGLTPWQVLQAVKQTAPRLVGFDVNEVSPPWDAGNTAALAARIAREVISEVWAAQGPG